MLKTGITDNEYINFYGREEGLRRIAAHGYYGVDCQLFVDTTRPYFDWSEEEFLGFVTDYKKAVRAAGLTVYQCHGPWRYPPQDVTPEDRAERMEKIRRALQGTAALDCKRLIFHPLMPFSTQDEGHERETWDINLPFLREMADYAAPLGITVCLENMPMRDFSIASTEQILKLVKAVGRPNFKVCLDTGHCAVMREDPAESVRLLGDCLEALHIHDNDGKRDLHLMPYSKTVDFDAFAKALSEIGFRGVLSLECHIGDKLPKVLREQEERLLSEKIRYMATLASGQEVKE
ncbi:MAG: sugar phosphate isomerase/epimerase [Clostridia bacterium]|nr:sugar phosphate isomerase/epimerase [Clostridia bacterium]